MSTFAEDMARTEFYIRLKAVHPIAACVLIELDQDERVLEERIGSKAMAALRAESKQSVIRKSQHVAKQATRQK